MLARMDTLYLDDLSVGQRFVSGMHTMDAGEITRFAADYDPQPFHMDEPAARDTLFGGLVASGWHTAVHHDAADRRTAACRSPAASSAPAASCCGRIRCVPAIRCTWNARCLEIMPSRSKPDRGTVTVRCMTRNQNGETVQSFTPKLVVPRRPPQ